jgi:glycosyltransferase involved in cell wall biosynthesis
MGSDVKSNSFMKYVIYLFSYFFNWRFIILKSADMKKNFNFAKISIIPNGVNIDIYTPNDKIKCQEFLNWDKAKKHILFPSNPKRVEKNFRMASDALKLMKSENIEVHFLDQIPQIDVPIWMNGSDVILLTSFWEGSPNVIKEAMACNIPIVTTNVGDVSWVIANTKGCFICGFDPMDVKLKLDEALVFSQKIGRTNGRQRIIELGLDSGSVARRIVQIYEKIS